MWDNFRFWAAWLSPVETEFSVLCLILLAHSLNNIITWLTTSNRFAWTKFAQGHVSVEIFEI